MREVSKDEAMRTLPVLLEQVKGEPVLIYTDGTSDGVLLSKKSYESMREAELMELRRLTGEVGANIQAHAAQLGISPEELVDDLLRDEV